LTRTLSRRDPGNILAKNWQSWLKLWTAIYAQTRTSISSGVVQRLQIVFAYRKYNNCS
jgi:hypothetical protein